MSIVAVSEFVFSELLHETKHIVETIEAKIILLTAIDVLILIQVQSYKSAKILPLYHAAGLTTIEITMNTPFAVDIIRHAVEQFKGRLNVGAGTVCSTDDLKMALEAGAQFIVTPILNAEVISTCVKSKIPVFPGAYTPTEIYQAWELGADIVKVYPATALGPDYIKDVKAPLNKIKLMPTGGISLNNIEVFMKSGADGLGIGGQLFDKQLIKNEDWDGLLAHFKKYVNCYLGTKND